MAKKGLNMPMNQDYSFTTQANALKVGNTPLIPLNNFKTNSMKILAKLEWFNPFGSLKDRAVYWMIKDAEVKGLLNKRDQVIIEPTSGNTGIALVGIASLMGYRVEVVIPDKISQETKDILISMGAEILETTDDLCPRVGKGTDQSIALAKAIVMGHPGKYFMPNQYENEANYMAHYESTGPEIWRNTEGKITHFIAGIGTGGTITGVAHYLKEKNPSIKIYAVEPQKGHHIQGLRNLEESLMPKLLEKRADLIDEWIRVSDDDAFKMVRKLASKEKLLVGPSSGAIMHAASRIAEKEKDGVAVTIFADDGRKYGSVYSQFNVFTEDEFNFFKKKGRFLDKNYLNLNF